MASNEQPPVKIHVPTLSASPRTRIVVVPLSGPIETFEATGPAQVGPGFLLIPMDRMVVGFSLSGILKWETTENPIHLGRIS